MTDPIHIPVCSLNDGTGNDGIKITPDLARQIVELSGISGKLDKTAQLAESKELSDAHFANWEKAMELNTELRAQLAEATAQRDEAVRLLIHYRGGIITAELQRQGDVFLSRIGGAK
jgi:hypothetical protein